MNVLITGSSSGIGLEFARLYAAQENSLILVSRSKLALNDVKQELITKFNCKNVRIIPLDLSKHGSAEELHKKVPDIDILINNAGVGDFGECVSMPIEKISAMISLNITALTELCMLYGRDFKNAKKGGVLNVASIAAFQPLPYFGAYSASKAYVLSFSLALAAELKEYNVTVTCLCPGTTKTNFFSAGGRAEISQEKGIMSASTVAALGKSGLERKLLIVIPGRQNRFFALAAKLLPHKIVLGYAKRMMEEYR